MKLIVENSTGLVKWALEDDKRVLMADEHLEIGEEGNLMKVICHSNKDCCLIENVTNTPDDWFGNKYKYINGNWSLNPTFIDPRPSE
jgi:hypothetical protein